MKEDIKEKFSHFDNKKILITGATGLICSHLVKDLLENSSAKIFALSRSREKLTNMYRDYIGERLEIIAQDVSETININCDINYIFHGAGSIDGATIKFKPIEVILPNIKGLLNCCDIAIRQKKKGGINPRIIVFSSSTVYNNLSNKDVILKEEDPLYTVDLHATTACYSESKRMLEVISNSMVSQYNIDAVICRFSYVYGSAFYKPETAFYQFIDTLKSGSGIIMNSAGLPRRDNIYIDDVISALAVIAQKGIAGEVYNISSGGEKNNFAAIDEIAAIMISIVNKNKDNKVDLVYKETSDGNRAPGMIFENSKLKELGWSVNSSLENGIERVLKYYNVI